MDSFQGFTPKVPHHGIDLCHNSPFQVISQTLEKHYSSNTIHQNTIHRFTIHRFRGPFDILRNFWGIYYSRNTIHFRKSFHHSLALRISS